MVFSAGENRAAEGVLMNMSLLHMEAVPFKRQSCVFCMDLCCMRCQLQNFNEAIFCASFPLSTGLSTRHIFSHCISFLEEIYAADNDT